MREIRVFANDEILTSLQHLPMAGDYSTFASFKSYLRVTYPIILPRPAQRRCNYILDRFYPDGDLNMLLDSLHTYNRSQEGLKSVCFIIWLKQNYY